MDFILRQRVPNTRGTQLPRETREGIPTTEKTELDDL